MYGQLDFYAAGVTCALTSVEASCTITAASIPLIRPLIRRLTGQRSNKRRSEALDMGALNLQSNRQSIKHGRVGNWSAGDGSITNDESKNDESVAVREVERGVQA